MTDIGVDAGGLFIGDIALLPENIDEYDVFRKIFGSPMRRAQSLSTGTGLIIDTDDGVFDVKGPICRDAAVKGVHTLAGIECYLVIQSGILTVCSIDCLIDAHLKETDRKRVRYEVGQGTYSFRALCSVVPSSREVWGARSVTDETHEARFCSVRREWVFGGVSQDEYDAAVAEYEQSQMWYMQSIEFALAPVASIPVAWEADDPVFEFKPSRSAVYAVLTG